QPACRVAADAVAEALAEALEDALRAVHAGETGTVGFVAVVAGGIDDGAEAARTADTLRQNLAAVRVVAIEVEHDARAVEAGADGPPAGGAEVLIRVGASAVDEDPHAHEPGGDGELAAAAVSIVASAIIDQRITQHPYRRAGEVVAGFV